MDRNLQNRVEFPDSVALAPRITLPEIFKRGSKLYNFEFITKFLGSFFQEITFCLII